MNFSISLPFTMFFFVFRFKQLCFGNHSEEDTCQYEFFLIMIDTTTSQNIDLSS